MDQTRWPKPSKLRAKIRDQLEGRWFFRMWAGYTGSSWLDGVVHITYSSTTIRWVGIWKIPVGFLLPVSNIDRQHPEKCSVMPKTSQGSPHSGSGFGIIFGFYTTCRIGVDCYLGLMVVDSTGYEFTSLTCTDLWYMALIHNFTLMILMMYVYLRIKLYICIYIVSVRYYIYVLYVVVFIFWFTAICTPVYISSTVHRTTLKQSQKSWSFQPSKTLI